MGDQAGANPREWVPSVADILRDTAGFAYRVGMGAIPNAPISPRDRAMALSLALADRTEMVGLLLGANPKLAEALGLDGQTIHDCFGVGGGRFPRLRAAQDLEAERQRMAGKLWWAHIEDLNVFLLTGTRIPVSARVWLSAKLHAIPGGWVMPQGWVSRFLDVFTAVPIVDADRLAAKAEGAPPNKSGRFAQDFPFDLVTVRVVSQQDGALSLDWDKPFGPAGQRVKDCVKRLGGVFTSPTWTVPEAALPALGSALAWDHEVSWEPLHPWLDKRSERDETVGEAVAAGTVPLELVGETIKEIKLRPAFRHKGLWDIVQSFGGKFEQRLGAYVVPKLALGDLLRALEPLEEVAAWEAIPALDRFEEDSLAHAAAAAAVVAPELTPTGTRLFRHQVDGVGFLLRSVGLDGLKGVILGDDMGLGKTLEAIIAADLLLGRRGPALVVTTASMKLAWRDEIVQWLGLGKRVTILEGLNGACPLPMTDWIIVNYDVLPAWADRIREAKPRLAILDEAQMLGTQGTVRAKALFGERKKPGILTGVDTVWCLTGTPLQNRPKELFNLLKAIGHPLGEDWMRYGLRYCGGKQGGFGWDFKGKSNLEELGERLRPYLLRRRKVDIQGLPEKIERDLRVTLDGDALAEYQRGYADLMARADETLEIATMTRLKRLTALAKAAVTLELAQAVLDAGNKVVIFSNYPEVLTRIQAKLKRGSSVLIHGGIAPRDRHGLVAAFQTDPKITTFLGQMSACGVGLNLTAAQHAFLNDLSWNPKVMAQAGDRIHRIGSQGVVNIVRVIAEGTFDRDLLAVVEPKMVMIDTFETSVAPTDSVEDLDVSPVIRDVLKRLRAR
jgi:SWI/SNF-related matrix-associated actin-dependent regulator 1 of chromatin subfamily A